MEPYSVGKAFGRNFKTLMIDVDEISPVSCRQRSEMAQFHSVEVAVVSHWYHTGALNPLALADLKCHLSFELHQLENHFFAIAYMLPSVISPLKIRIICEFKIVSGKKTRPHESLST